MNDLKTPSHDLEAERAILGCLLLDRRATDIIVHELGIKAGEFFHPGHVLIFDAASRLIERRIGVDYVTLNRELESSGNLTSAGGITYVAGLANVVPSVKNARYYGGIVRELARKREIARICLEGYDQATAGGDSRDIGVGLTNRLLGVVRERKELTQTRSISEVIQSLDQENQDRAAGRALPPISFGYPRLDALVQLRPGHIMVIAGRSSIGKTSLATGLGVRVALAGSAILWISAEMSHSEMASRFIAACSDIELYGLQRGHHENLMHDPRVADLLKTNIQQVFMPGGTEQEIGRIVTECAARHPIKLVVVDYIQRLTYSGAGRNSNDASSMSKISGYLKRLAGETGIPFIVLSQMPNPTGEDRRTPREPELWDLKWSGDIGNDADVVLFIHKDFGRDGDKDYYMRWLIRKNRHGARGEIKTMFHCARAEFEEREWRYQT